MTHLWVRSEQRANEDRVGLTPKGASALLKKGISVTSKRAKAGSSRQRPIAPQDAQ